MNATTNTLFPEVAGESQKTLVSDLTTITDTGIKRFKELVWEKNFNHKLCCDGFVHIDLAPRQMPAPAQLQEVAFLISNREDDVKGCFRLLDIKLIRAELVPESVVAASHGVTSLEFFEAMFGNNPGTFRWNTLLAIYFYLRIKP